MNAITTTPMPLSYDALERLAESIAKSGLFGMKTKDQAIALMMIAHAEGTHPALAARDYDVIQGKPAKKAEAMMRDFVAAGGKVEWHSLTDDLADATFTHPQTGSVRIDWNIERARVAGFAGKDNWKKFPRAMLRSRVVSEGVRTIWPLATSGMYVQEEVEDIPAKAEHNGPTLEHAASDAREQMNRDVPLKAAASDMKRAAKIADKAKVYEAVDEDVSRYADIYAKHDIAIELLDETEGRKWLDNLEMLLANATTQETVVVISDHESVKRAIAKAPGAVKARVSELLAKAYKRFVEPEGEELPEDDEVLITGEHNVMAGD